MTHVWFHVCLGYLLPNVFVNLFHIQVIRVYHYDFDRLSQELSNAGCDVINPGYDIFLVLGQKCARLLPLLSGGLRWRPWVCRQPHGADSQTSAELCWTKWASLRTIITGTSGPELLNCYISLIKLTIFFRDETFNSVKFYWNTIQWLTEEVLYKVSFYSIQSCLSAYYFFFSQGCAYFNG